MKKKNIIAVVIVLIMFTALNGTMLFYNYKLVADKKDNLSYLVLEDETDQNKNTNMQVWNLKDEETSWHGCCAESPWGRVQRRGAEQAGRWRRGASKYGCRLQGTTDVAFTVLDVLGYLDEIPVCTGYEIDGEVTTEFPTTVQLEKAKPVIEKLPGWKCDIRGIKKYEDLPENCRKYVEFVEKHIGFPITMISNGPGRSDIIYR